MAGLELLIIGMTTAFLGASNSAETTRSRRQNNTNYVSVAGSLFVSHRQSFGALLSSNGAGDSRIAARDVLADLSFDDEVESLLEHGW